MQVKTVTPADVCKHAVYTALLERLTLTPAHIIFQYFDCKQHLKLRGYRFAFIPLCRCCRTRKDLHVLNNQIGRGRKR